MEGLVVVLFGLLGIGLEEGRGADFKGEGTRTDGEFFGDVVGAIDVVFKKLGGLSLDGLLDADEDGDVGIDGFYCLFKGIDIFFGQCIVGIA